MELKEYWAVVQRYWLPVVGLTLATLAASTLFALRGPSAFKADYTLAVSIAPEGRDGPYFTYNAYYEWLSSEYLADDLSRLIESETFAEDVTELMGERGEPQSVSQVTRVRKTHRMLDVTITDSSPDRALKIASAQEQVLNSKMGSYLAQLKADNGQVKIINHPRVRRATTPAGMAVEIGLRTLVGLLAGIGIAFLLNYLDGTTRERREVEQIFNAPVLGEIPLGPRA